MNSRTTSFENEELVRENRRILTRNGAPLLFAYEATTFWQRFRGVKAIPELGPTDALVINPCSSIHTFGLKDALDVVFVGVRGEILKVKTVKPRSVCFCFDAALVIEMTAGTIERLDFQVGQRIVPENSLWRQE